MKLWDTVVIVGVGLIGGSIGLDLRAKKLARRVIGVGRRASTLKAAKAAGCVHETTLRLDRASAEADLVIVCTPVGRIVEDVWTAAAAAKPGTLVTDAGSTKGSIVAALDGVLPEGVTFVGSHPLAGGEKSGPMAAVRDLFFGRTTIVTPTEITPPAALKKIEAFWKRLGSRVVEMSPDEHDRTVAATSHVPHVIASALAATTSEEYLPLTAGGWLDTTRVAAADTALWTQILTDNREHVRRALKSVERTIANFRLALEHDDRELLTRLLEAGRRTRNLAAGLSPAHTKPRKGKPRG